MVSSDFLQNRAPTTLAAGACIVLLGICVGIAQDPQPKQPAPDPVARGVVFEDLNENGKRDADEPGLPGVRVSNQQQIVVTGKDGSWELPSSDDVTYFVIKPRGWRTPVTEDNLPRFYYHHRPKGSPALRFRGIEPTGDLPASIDFPLVKSPEPDKFDVVFFADPQPDNLKELDWVANDAIREIVGTDAAFGVTLGDIVGNDLSLFEPMNRALSHAGVPWYNVIGNHDLNFDAEGDADSDEAFRRVYGPSYYSFDYGGVHFVALDNVHWNGRSYMGLLSKPQLDWLAEDLKHVPKDQLIVLMMHIPLKTRLPSASSNTVDRAELLELVKDRRAFAVAGHPHMHMHTFLGPEDGWPGEGEFEHIDMVAVSGNWWRGDPDDRGIPHATGRDGAPNGYMIATFDNGRHSLRFKAAGRDADYQMLIQAPDAVWSDRAADVQVYANVFGGSQKSEVEWRVGGGEWQAMQWTFEADPQYVRMAETQALPRPLASEHLWKSELPTTFARGHTRSMCARRTSTGRCLKTGASYG